MEDFRRQFLLETAEKLENLHRILRAAENISAETKRETFRLLHTVKGTAQTFGYAATSRLAHDLETLLCADGDRPYLLLIEGVEMLRKSLRDKKFQPSERFVEKLRALIPQTAATADDLNDQTAKIPDEFYAQLSNREKEVVNAAMRGGQSSAILEIGFDAKDFAAGLINFRAALDSKGEIVATFPSRKLNAGGKIGFQFLTIGLDDAQSFAAANGARVLWADSAAETANDPGAVWRQIVRHGADIAARLGKRIAFEANGDESDLSAAELKIVFETLLHLVRNAVDHGVENAGTIIINLKTEANGRRFSVSDDGRGIDLARVKAKAVEKNLISNAENLSEKETLALIFQPEFSTASETTEISGRGIGLDAVKNAVEKAGGEISVETAKGKGTTFEIFLPRG